MLTGNQMRDARSRARMTQEQLAERLGVTLRTVGNWERSSVPATREGLVRSVLDVYLEAGAQSPGSESVVLTEVSDALLLAEIARRFERGREAGGHGGNAAPTSKAGPAGTITDLTSRQAAADEAPLEEILEQAADTDHTKREPR